LAQAAALRELGDVRSAASGGLDPSGARDGGHDGDPPLGLPAGARGDERGQAAGADRDVAHARALLRADRAGGAATGGGVRPVHGGAALVGGRDPGPADARGAPGSPAIGRREGRADGPEGRTRPRARPRARVRTGRVGPAPRRHGRPQSRRDPAADVLQGSGQLGESDLHPPLANREPRIAGEGRYLISTYWPPFSAARAFMKRLEPNEIVWMTICRSRFSLRTSRRMSSGSMT